MNSVLMGLNRFENCRILIAWCEHPVLRAEAGLSSLQFDTTGLGEKIRAVRVEGHNVTVGENDCRLIASDAGTTVLVGRDQAIVSAIRIDEHPLHIKLDLRLTQIGIALVVGVDVAAVEGDVPRVRCGERDGRQPIPF